MEFWGVEVKSGESLKVDPGDDKIIHLSNACLGDVTKAKGGESVALNVKFGNQKLVLGTLSTAKFPQISYDLIFEKEFELSHSWKNGSVFFTGFKAQSQSESDNDEDSDDLDEDIPVSAANGKPEFEVKHGVKPDEAKQKKTTDPKKNEKVKEKDANGEDEDSSESDSDGDSSEDKPTANGDIESSEGDEDSDDEDDDEDEDDEESDEETPKKIEAGKKRNIDSANKTTVPVKKAKFVTPQKPGHMTQLGKKNLSLFQSLRKELTEKSKNAGDTEVPNMQDPLVEVRVHGGTKRKATIPIQKGVGKDIKRIMTELLGPGSSSGIKRPEVGLIELPETTVGCDIEINLEEAVLSSLDNMEPIAMAKAMVEFNSKALILCRRVGCLLQKELKEGGKAKIEQVNEELKVLQAKYEVDKEAWDREREELVAEKKQLGSWKVRCLDSEKKMKEKIEDLEANNDELKEKYQRIESELEDLKDYIVQEHINGFHKGLRQAALFYKEVDATDPRYDVYKDVFKGRLLDEEEMDSDQPVEEPEATVDPAVEEEVTANDEAEITTK